MTCYNQLIIQYHMILHAACSRTAAARSLRNPVRACHARRLAATLVAQSWMRAYMHIIYYTRLYIYIYIYIYIYMYCIHMYTSLSLSISLISIYISLYIYISRAGRAPPRATPATPCAGRPSLWFTIVYTYVCVSIYIYC